MLSLHRIQTMLSTCSTGDGCIPPTTLYNEGWMMRLVLDWFSRHVLRDHPLSCPEEGTWYSEALLPSAFLARHRGDALAESRTHADGVIGHITVGQTGSVDLTLMDDGRHLVVLEAKMFSSLSTGVTNAPYYDQAARSVACMAEVLRRGGRSPLDMTSLGFYVVAPLCQVDRGVFSEYLRYGAIQETVERRVREYGGTRDEWFERWFLPTLQYTDIRPLCWEGLIDCIAEADLRSGEEIKTFYELCLLYNSRHSRN